MDGDLALDAKGGELRLQKPLIYQDIDGIRKQVPGGYVLHPVKIELVPLKEEHEMKAKLTLFTTLVFILVDIAFAVDPVPDIKASHSSKNVCIAKKLFWK